MLSRCRTMFMMFLLPAIISAGPKIAVDTPVFDIGRVFDGKHKDFKHVFKVQNTGDAPLVISSIRKSCGCTSVSFDSIIPPGGTGFITEVVKIEEEASPGEFSMPITVLSDARNSPILKLSVKGILEFFIDAEPVSFLLSDSLGKDSAETVMILRSNMKGLKVTGVSFSFNEQNKAFTWKASFPMNFSFSAATAGDLIKVKPAKSKINVIEPNTKYAYVYTLKIKYPNNEHISRFGDLIIHSNHPEKPEIKMVGSIVIR